MKKQMSKSMDKRLKDEGKKGKGKAVKASYEEPMRPKKPNTSARKK